MDELIGFLFIGFIEILFTAKRGWGPFIAIWLVVIMVGGIIYMISTAPDVVETDIPAPTEQNVELSADRSVTEQSFIDLCKRNDGTPTRDFDNPAKLICL